MQKVLNTWILARKSVPLCRLSKVGMLRIVFLHGASHYGLSLGTAYVNIREYYGSDEADLKPGKKGITLTSEQWKVLKDNFAELDALLESAE
jgi:hypothetical protein